MPVFMVKVRMENGVRLLPITVACDTAETAVAMVKKLSYVSSMDSVESKGIRADVMKEAFGDQPDGTIVTRIDWIWSPQDTPIPKPE